MVVSLTSLVIMKIKRSKYIYNHFEDKVIKICRGTDVEKAWKQKNQQTFHKTVGLGQKRSQKFCFDLISFGIYVRDHVETV